MRRPRNPRLCDVRGCPCRVQPSCRRLEIGRAPTTLAPDSATLAPDSATLAPDSATLAPDSATLAPDSATLAPDSATLAPDSATLAPDSARPVAVARMACSAWRTRITQ